MNYYINWKERVGVLIIFIITVSLGLIIVTEKIKILYFIQMAIILILYNIEVFYYKISIMSDHISVRSILVSKYIKFNRIKTMYLDKTKNGKVVLIIEGKDFVSNYIEIFPHRISNGDKLIEELLKIEQVLAQEKKSNNEGNVKQRNGFQNIDGQILGKIVIFSLVSLQIILFLTQVILILKEI